MDGHEKEATIGLASPDATCALGKLLAPLVGAGDTILLSGPLGSGKTHLARALIQQKLHVAGTIEDVPSPTFTLVQTYDAGNLTILHADLYRLQDGADITELGIGEDPSALTLIEWPERMAIRIRSALRLRFELTEDGRSRSVALNGPKDRWGAVIEAVQRDFGKWP